MTKGAVMNGRRDIAERLAKLEALFARGATAGERAAAGAAIGRLQTRLDPARREPEAPEIELQYSLPDLWSLRLFIAICRKHGVRPYRYPRQRRTTLVVRVRKAEFERTVGAEFDMLHRELARAFEVIVDHLVADVMHSDGDDAGLEQRRLPE
jgi:hypothetical protein